MLPIAGDTIGALLGAYMVWEARNLGMSKLQMARMVGNVGTDWLLGLIPVIGIDSRLLLQIELAQPEDHSAPSRPAFPRDTATIEG